MIDQRLLRLSLGRLGMVIEVRMVIIFMEKKKLRQIDSRIKFLTSVIEDANIIHLNDQINTDKIFFGAYVELCQGKSKKKLNLRIVGQHETTHD